jgi:Kef-type K+ transport system membrane component KefB
MAEIVSHFLLQILVLLLAAFVLGQVARRLGISSLVGEILAGVLLGPTVIGHWFPGLISSIFESDEHQVRLISAFTWLGLLFYLLEAGLEVDLPLLKRKGYQCLVVSLGGLVLPMASGYALGCFLPADYLNHAADRQPLSLFLAVAMSISAIVGIAAVLRVSGRMRQEMAQIMLGAAMLDDVVAWVLVAIVSALYASGHFDLGVAGRSLGAALVFLVLSFTVGQPILDRLMRWSTRLAPGAGAQLAFVLIAGIGFSLITNELNLETVLGIFVAGMLLGSLPSLGKNSAHALTMTVSALFAPLYFGLVGLRLNLWSLSGIEALWMLLLVIGLAVLGKLIGVYLGAWAVGRPFWERVAMGLSMNGRGGSEIVMATVGLTIGLLSQQLYTLIVIMAVATLLMSVPAGIWAIGRCGRDPEPEDPAIPIHIDDKAIEEPSRALDLVEQEQMRLARRLPAYCEAFRTENGSAAREAASRIHAPFAALGRAVDRFMQTLLSQSLDATDLERLTALQTRQSFLLALDQCLENLRTKAAAVAPGGRLASTFSSFNESLDFLLMNMLEALSSGGEEEIRSFLELTGERGALLEALRARYMAPEENLSVSEKSTLFHLIDTFRQALWLMNGEAQRLAAARVGGGLLA